MKPVTPSIVAISGPQARRALRVAAIAARTALDDTVRACFDQQIAVALGARLSKHPAASIGSYWPMRGEPDLRAAMRAWHEAGIVIALPRVVDAHQALRFVRWTPQTVLRETRHGAEIVEPAQPVEIEPELLLVPCVGFNRDRYRLGYGGGFYDRTLAARPIRSWGIAYECGRLDDLAPAAHDIALDAIITEAAVY